MMQAQTKIMKNAPPSTNIIYLYIIKLMKGIIIVLMHIYSIKYYNRHYIFRMNDCCIQ